MVDKNTRESSEKRRVEWENDVQVEEEKKKRKNGWGRADRGTERKRREMKRVDQMEGWRWSVRM